MSLLSTAFELFHKNLMPIPILPHSKHAAIAWKHYQEVPPTFNDIINLFKYHTGNIGILTGQVSGNLAVLDFDSPASYCEWLTKFRHLADSYSVRSSRGTHVYLRVENLPERTYKVGQCDIKVSGYVLCPPSVHPNGTQYWTLNDSEIREIKRIEECGMSPSINECSTSPVIVNVYGSNNTVNVTVPPNTRRVSNASIISTIKQEVPITTLFPQYYPSGDGKAMTHCPTQAHERGDANPSLSLDLVSNRCQCLKPGCPLNGRHGNDVIDTFAVLNGLTLKQAIAQMASDLGF